MGKCMLGALLVISGCTVVYIEEHLNTVSDVGGHGGGIELLRPDKQALLLKR